jgi:hypothetical protein
VFNTDSHFHIGAFHLTQGKPCQDYCASAGGIDGITYAIVSDGCSTGGHTDVGSRILVLSTATALKQHWSVHRTTQGEAIPKQISVQQKIVMGTAQQTLGLSQQDMLATCIYVYLSEDGGFVNIQGDGVVAYKYRDGALSLCRYEWDCNTPFYPAYANDHYAAFIGAHGGDVSVEKLNVECWEFAADKWHACPSRAFTLSQGIEGIVSPISLEDLRNLEFIAIFSDGVTQVSRVNWKKAAQQLLAFKSTEGAFVKRRMNRFLKDSQIRGSGPLDDLACAVIHVTPPQETNDDH